MTGHFFNPNVHPFREYERRVEAMETVADRLGLPVLWAPEGYDLHRWFEAVGPETDPGRRCPACYRLRLSAAAAAAKAHGFPAFSTTLLYSRYQRHAEIRAAGEAAAREAGVAFHYEDFREGWAAGIEAARALGIYRQPYCGCLFSEGERYAARAERLRRRLAAPAAGRAA